MIKSEYRVSRDGNKIDKCCLESEVRQLESDYAKLEAQLGEAVELLSSIVRRGQMFGTMSEKDFAEIHRLAYSFLTTLDQEKEKSDEV